MDVTMPGNTRVCDKEREKIKKYSLLKDKIVRLWQMKKVAVIPIVVGALGAITTKFKKYIESLGIFRNSQNNKEGTTLLSTQKRILLWDLQRLIDA